MSSFVFELVKGFMEADKDLRGDYVEHWLNGKVKDYDMDMQLIEAKKLSHNYNKIQNRHEVS